MILICVIALCIQERQTVFQSVQCVLYNRLLNWFLKYRLMHTSGQNEFESKSNKASRNQWQ